MLLPCGLAVYQQHGLEAAEEALQRPAQLPAPGLIALPAPAPVLTNPALLRLLCHALQVGLGRVLIDGLGLETVVRINSPMRVRPAAGSR